MSLSQFMVTLDQTIVNVALPSMQRQLSMTPGDLEWVIGAYTLSLAALVPTAGALGDRFGRKRVYLAGVAVFATGSIVCALSRDDTALIISRSVQGIGGSALLSLTLSILTHSFPPERRAATVGTWAAIGGLGFGTGPVAGGVLLSFFGWSSVFWVNVPFAILAFVFGSVAVSEYRNPSDASLDIPGMLSAALGLLAVTYGLIAATGHPWGSTQVAGPLVIGVVLLVGYVWWEKRARHPMMPSQLLRAPSFVTSTAVLCCGTITMTGVLFWATLLFQDVRGWSVLRTGLSWVLMNAPFIAAARLTGRFIRRFSPSAVAGAGCLVMAVGIVVISRSSDTTTFLLTGSGYVLLGLGSGTFYPAVTHMAMRDVPADVSGAAAGILSAIRQAGAPVGLAVLGSIGVRAAVSSWSGRVTGVARTLAAQTTVQGQNVGGGRIGAVVAALGPKFRAPATASFDHGFTLAVGAAGALMLVAAVAAVIGLRRSTAGASPDDRALSRDQLEASALITD